MRKNNDIKYLFFDLDGTILDSMSYWGSLLGEYLTKNQIKHPAEYDMTSMDLPPEEMVKLIKNKFGVKDDQQKIINDLDYLMQQHYLNDINLKKDAAETLYALNNNGYKIYLTSLTDKKLFTAALSKYKISEHFKEIIETKAIKAEKKETEYWLNILNYTEAKKKECLIVDDSLDALKAGKESGIAICGVYDDYYQHEQIKIQSLCDHYIVNVSDLLKIL